MVLFRKLFYMKPPDGLLKIYDRVYGLSSLCVFSSTLIHSLFRFKNFVQFRFSTLHFCCLELETKTLVFNCFLYLEWNRNWVSLSKLFICWVSLSKLPSSMMPAKLQDIIETLSIDRWGTKSLYPFLGFQSSYEISGFCYTRTGILVIAVYDGNLVKTLPGYNGDLPFTLETG